VLEPRNVLQHVRKVLPVLLYAGAPRRARARLPGPRFAAVVFFFELCDRPRAHVAQALAHELVLRPRLYVAVQVEFLKSKSWKPVVLHFTRLKWLKLYALPTCNWHVSEQYSTDLQTPHERSLLVAAACVQHTIQVNRFVLR
jgi:hypothetical protein